MRGREITTGIGRCGGRGLIAVLVGTLGLGLAAADAPGASVVNIGPATPGEAVSADFQVTVEGRSVPVYTARVSALPVNHIWPGFPSIRCERPLEQTEIASFASWDMSGPVRVEVASTRPVQSVAVRPTARGIRPVVEGQRIRFTLASPGPVTVEVNGAARALHLFASPPEKAIPRPDAPATRYFGPGVHRPGIMHLRSGETLYLAAGAVVHGAVLVDDAENVTICGRGILDVSSLKRGQSPGAISLAGCRNVRVEGLIIRDTNRWAVVPSACRDVTISGLKLIGFWRYNADGINVCNSENVVIEDCFIRAFDDCVTMKGMDRKHHRFTELGRGLPLDELPTRRVTIARCVIWNDWGVALKFGSETSAPEIADIRFVDCDILRTAGAAISIHLSGPAAIHDVCFERLRVELDRDPPWPYIQKRLDEKYPYAGKPGYYPTLMDMNIDKSYWGFTDNERRGTIRDVLVKDVAVTGPAMPRSRLRGYSAEGDIRNVTIENLRFNGKPISTAEAGGFKIGDHVAGVTFR
jgi:hypothetical protein